MYYTELQFQLIELLKKSEFVLRRDMVRQLNKPRTTIYDNLLKLQKSKVVEKFSKNNGVGRPLVYWRLK